MAQKQGFSTSSLENSGAGRSELSALPSLPAAVRATCTPGDGGWCKATSPAALAVSSCWRSAISQAASRCNTAAAAVYLPESRRAAKNLGWYCGSGPADSSSSLRNESMAVPKHLLGPQITLSFKFFLEQHPNTTLACQAAVCCYYADGHGAAAAQSRTVAAAGCRLSPSHCHSR